MNSTDVLNNSLKNEREMFLSKLQSFVILDIGTIVEVKNGRAKVNSSSFVGGQQTIYDDAEVIFPGNESGAYDVECAGTPCLIFIPMSCMPNIMNRNVRLRSASYSGAGVKVMPIGNAVNAIVKSRVGAGGVLSVLSKNYNISFTEDSINLERGDVAASVSMDETGGLHIIKQGQASTHYVDMIDGSTTSTFQSTNKDVQWVDTLNSDGSRTFVQNNPQDEDADPLFSMTITKEGKLVFTNATDIDLTVVGNANIDIQGEDGATVHVAGDAVVSVDGDTKIDAENIELNGNDKRLVTYAELKAAMDKLWVALTTTPIAGNGSPQPSWTGITGIDISASETQTIKTGG